MLYSRNESETLYKSIHKTKTYINQIRLPHTDLDLWCGRAGALVPNPTT